MECNEFRKKIVENTDISKELIEHKNNCKDCQEWFLNELTTPPDELSKEEWQKALSKITNNNIDEKKTDSTNNTDSKTDKSDNLNNSDLESNKKAKEEKESEEEPTNSEEDKSFLGYYFSGLKYGIIFGLSIVVGFSIIQNNNESKPSIAQNNSSIASETANIASESIKIIATHSKDLR